MWTNKFKGLPHENDLILSCCVPITVSYFKRIIGRTTRCDGRRHPVGDTTDARSEGSRAIGEDRG